MASRDGGAGGWFVHRAVTAAARELPCPPPPDDESWPALARSQGVLGVVADALRRAGHPTDHPAVARAQLTGAATQLSVLADLRPLARELDAAGARWVVLKGPVLSAAYRRRGVRAYSDLDVLVHPADLAATLTRLVPARAELVHRNWTRLARLASGEIGLRLPGGTPLDLHWHVVNRAERRRDLAVPVTDLLASRQPVLLDGVPAWSLQPVDVVLHTAMHGCLSGAHSLKWLLDLQQALLWADPDPAELRDRAEETGTALLLAVMLDRTARHLDPAVRHWAARLPRSLWSALADAVSRRFPPGAAARGRHSGATVFSATRQGSARSLQRAAQQLARNRLLVWGLRSRPEPGALELPAGGDERRAEWLAHASHHG